ncbi:transcription termination factor, mitochondrial [Cylas formicarius]|uniref:transcription termination factor, mitochondrial n=1 Tax=Cylas formicarius TaxID=197179 RepID=UPI002958B329|nr:transcription termination factor, mitochondrial [Cylas formicarius]
MRLFIRLNKLLRSNPSVSPQLTSRNCILFYSKVAVDCDDERNLVKHKEKSLNKVKLKLQELLRIHGLDALNIIERHRELVHTSTSMIDKNYNYFIESGISHTKLLIYPELLATNDLLEKIDILKTLPHPMKVTLPLLKLSLATIKRLCENDRIDELSKFLKLPLPETCCIIAAKPFLVTVDQDHLNESLKLLMDHGIAFQDVVKDLWILRYSTKLLKSKLEYLKKHEIDIKKPWLIRCTDGTLARHIKKDLENKSVLGDEAVIEYISERLCCPLETAREFVHKYPRLRRKSLLKIKEMTDLLYGYGFTSDDICRVPKIFLCSIETIKTRLKEMHSRGVVTQKLYILTKSKKEYLQYYGTSSDKDWIPYKTSLC